MAGRTDNGIMVQDRDLAILLGLFESRVATLAHLADLFFDGRKEATKKRLQKLKSAGLIRERARRASEPALLFLTTDAFDLLAQRGLLAPYPHLGRKAFEKRIQVSLATMLHELDVVSAKASVVRALAGSDTLRVAEFCTWPALNEFETESRTQGRVAVKPDGFLRLHENSAQGELFEHNFYVEVDRSTESQQVVAQKVANYLEHYRSGGFAASLGLTREQYKEAPFRVLMLFRNAERCHNAAERLLQNDPPIRTMAWLATHDDFFKDPLGKIWMRPHDYDKATRDTPFAVGKVNGLVYRRNVARDEWVTRHTERLRLLDEEADTTAT
jgi:hypothetical protein